MTSRAPPRTLHLVQPLLPHRFATLDLVLLVESARRSHSTPVMTGWILIDQCKTVSPPVSGSKPLILAVEMKVTDAGSLAMVLSMVKSQASFMTGESAWLATDLSVPVLAIRKHLFQVVQDTMTVSGTMLPSRATAPLDGLHCGLMASWKAMQSAAPRGLTHQRPSPLDHCTRNTHIRSLALLMRCASMTAS